MSLPAPLVDEDDDDDLDYAAHVRLARRCAGSRRPTPSSPSSSMAAEDIDDLIADVESVAERLEAHAGAARRSAAGPTSCSTTPGGRCR